MSAVKNRELQWLQKLNIDGVNLSMSEMLYYQSKTSLLSLRPEKTVQARLAGTYLTKMKGRGMEFDEARHYQPGDDIRAIDWRVTARTGKTHTKLFREEKERPIFIVVDLGKSMHFGTQLMFKSVQAAHLASLISWSASKRGDRIGGLIFNQDTHLEFKPRTRQKAVLTLLNGLQQIHATPSKQSSGNSALEDACAKTRRLAKPGSAVFIISDFVTVSETLKQHISRLSRHCEVVAYRISDPFEHALPSVKTPQQVVLTDGQDRQAIVLGEKQQSLMYQRQHDLMFAENAHRLKQAKARVVDICASSPIEYQLNPTQQYEPT
ncbi:MAG: DUF58 domain-containing protein [Aestuariibacter sp.]